MGKTIQTNHGDIITPAFMPDATYGSIRTASFVDIRKAGINEIVTTTLHLEQKIGSQYIKQFGGIHKFFGWDRPILSDSGGWQVFSLINSHKANKQNRISEAGCSFVDPSNGQYSLLTPESSIQIQFNLGADIMTVLDNPIVGNSSLKDRKHSVEINTKWAKRAKDQFKIINEQLSKKDINKTKDYGQKTTIDRSKTGYHHPSSIIFKPLLGCVIQGGDDFVLRKKSAEELLEIGFDIYNFGGIPLNSGLTWKEDENKGKFYREMLHYVSELIPDTKLKYAMGVGQPEDIAFCISVGWDLFDTVLPTRNARHGYLYVSEGQGDVEREVENLKLNYSILHLKSDRYKFDEKPVDENCDCECCRTVSRAYLRHLIRINEPAGHRLCTVHNLRFYARWMERLRG